MRITVLLTNFLAFLGGIDFLISGLFGVNLSGIILGVGSFWQRLYFCLVGSSALFFVAVILIYSPLKVWLKRKP